MTREDCPGPVGMDNNFKNYYELYKKCELCPRKCGVDRTTGERGYCGAGTEAEVALTMIHKWEEPCISGTPDGASGRVEPGSIAHGVDRGSGTVFFTHCTLGCIYCQNYAISRRESGSRGELKKLKKYDANGLAEEFIRLERSGAYNINLVTPTHYMPVIAEAVAVARKAGLSVPVVYNTGGFERPEIIKMLRGTVDIFLTDMKYLTDVTAKKYSRTGDYVKNAWEALDEMVSVTGGSPAFGDDGMLKRGVIVRHLILPGRIRAAQEIIKKLYGRFSDNIIYSLMNQYTPLSEGNPELSLYPELLDTVNDRDYSKVVRVLESFSPEFAYIQEGGTVSESFIPEW